jgi:NAD(P) transhydrogenase
MQSHSDMLLKVSSTPRSLTVVGAGVIGVEYSCVAAALGNLVTLVEKRPSMLEFVDQEVVENLRFQMREMGITFRFGEEVAGVRKSSDGWVIAELKSHKVIQSDALLYCAGREGNTLLVFQLGDHGVEGFRARSRRRRPWRCCCATVTGATVTNIVAMTTALVANCFMGIFPKVMLRVVCGLQVRRTGCRSAVFLPVRGIGF